MIVGCLGVLAPRFLIVWLWGFHDYFARPYETWYWPLLGFFFMPYTTLMYAYLMRSYGPGFQGWQIVALIISAVMDLGSAGNARARSGQKG